MTPDTRTTHPNPADSPNSTPNSDPGGNANIDNYLRQALNIAYVELGGAGIEKHVTLRDARSYVTDRIWTVRSWPDSPQPEAFPFVQKSGSQEGE